MPIDLSRRPPARGLAPRAADRRRPPRAPKARSTNVETKFFTTKSFQLESGTVMPEITHRLRDLRQAGAGRPQRRAADPRLHLEPAHGRPLRRREAGERRRGLVGRAGRPGQGDRHRPAVRRVVQHAGLVLRLDQPGPQEPGDRQALRPGLPRHHPGRHRQRAEGAARQPRRQAPRRRRRPVVRRLPGLPVGRHLSRLHGRAGAGRQRAQGLGRRGLGQGADRPARQGSATGTAAGTTTMAASPAC